MSTRTKIALAAGVTALGIWAATGLIPDAPASATCTRVWALGPCDEAKALAVQPVACQAGDVMVPIEICHDSKETEPAEVPEGWSLLPSTAHLASAPLRPSKALTVVPRTTSCIAGKVRRDTSEAQDGSRWWTPKEPAVCCGVRCECLDTPCVEVAPHALAGRETWRARLCEQRPALCEQGGE